MTVDLRDIEASRLGGAASENGTGSSVPPRPPAVSRSRAQKFFGRYGDPKYAVFVVVGLILLYQIAIPLAMLIWSSVVEARPGSDGYLSLDAFTLENYRRGFTGNRFSSVIWDTTIFSLGTTAFAFIMGTFLAWVVERTDTPWRTFITIAMILRLILPGILTTISWIFLASPEIGTLNVWAMSIFGLASPPFDIYGMLGMIWVEGLDLIPLVYLLISASFRSMDPSLEEASLVSGKGLLSTTRLVTLPLILPAILATLILLFIRGIETFETPALLGIPRGVNTFVVEIWRRTSSSPTDYGLSSVYAILILALCSCLLWFYNRMTKHANSFAVISGKAFRPRRTELGAMRWVTWAISMVIIILSLGLPMLILTWASFYPPYRGFQPISIEGMSLLSVDNFQAVFDNGLVRRAFVNSTFLGITTATIIVFLITLTAWVTVKTDIKGRKWLDHLAFAPIAIPAISMGVAFLWLYLTLPVPVYGTIWILLLLYIARYTAVAMRMMSAAMTQLSDELQEAAEVSGASWFRSFRTVTMPLLRPAMLAAWIYVLIHAYRELSASIMVYSYGNEPIGVAILELWENGSFSLLSAFGMLVTISLIAFAIVARLISSRYGVKEE
jgi:iron(III) transport system permease protein